MKKIDDHPLEKPLLDPASSKRVLYEGMSAPGVVDSSA